MNHNVSQETKSPPRFRSLVGTALVFGGALFAVTPQAEAQYVSFPPTPDIITPPAGNFPFLFGRAEGCLLYTSDAADE